MNTKMLGRSLRLNVQAYRASEGQNNKFRGSPQYQNPYKTSYTRREVEPTKPATNFAESPAAPAPQRSAPNQKTSRDAPMRRAYRTSEGPRESMMDSIDTPQAQVIKTEEVDVQSILSEQASKKSPTDNRTLGHHIASRLTEMGIKDYFAVPGDYNLILLDQLLEEPRLNMISCCNELNAGYAADGYARAKGAACVVVTFSVGGLSVINAIAGAYSESLPVICISGGPNSSDFSSNRILHHTIGIPDFSQQHQCFKQVTCCQVIIQSLDNAYELLDHAFTQALEHKKPVYIEISCNLAGIPYPTFQRQPVPLALPSMRSNPQALEAAVDAAVKFLDKSVKPVLVAGNKLRMSEAEEEFLGLAEASEYPVAIMPSAKGMFPEDHLHFIGTYWGNVSSPYCAEIVESADAYIFAGPVFNDYSSVGYSLLIKPEKMIKVDPESVSIGKSFTFTNVYMRDFLSALAKRVTPNGAAFVNHQRMYIPPASAPLAEVPNAEDAIKTMTLFAHIQNMLTPNSAVIAETGDSWFNCQKLRLPPGCGYEFQMQYGSIGWAVGATLGYSLAAREHGKRVILCIGDGSFQMTAQEVSTMIRYGANPIIFLLNNGGYTIEVEIHDGIYNVIKNWNYEGFVQSMANGEGKVFTSQVRTEAELVESIRQAEELQDHLCFIEIFLHKDDCSKELLEWGSRVASANGRPPARP